MSQLSKLRLRVNTFSFCAIFFAAMLFANLLSAQVGQNIQTLDPNYGNSGGLAGGSGNLYTQTLAVTEDPSTASDPNLFQIMPSVHPANVLGSRELCDGSSEGPDYLYQILVPVGKRLTCEDVTYTICRRGDFGHPAEKVYIVDENDIVIGFVDSSGGGSSTDCTPDQQCITSTISACAYNEMAADGEIALAIHTPGGNPGTSAADVDNVCTVPFGPGDYNNDGTVDGNCVELTVFSVVINDVDPGFTASSTAECLGDAVTLIPNPTSCTQTWSVNGGNTGLSGTSGTVTFDAPSPGIYNICNTVGLAACDMQECMSITIYGLPTLPDPTTNSPVCNNDDATAMIGNASGGTAPYSYQWQVNFGSGFSDLSDDASVMGSSSQNLSLPSIEISYDNAMLRVVVTDANGCQATSNSTTLVVNECTPELTVMKPTPVISTPSASGIPGNVNATYAFTICNVGPVLVQNINLIDDLATQLDAGFVNVIGDPSIDGGGTTTDNPSSVNTNYEGTSPNDNLLSGNGDLDLGECLTVNVTVEVDLDMLPSNAANQASASGTSALGIQAAAISDNAAGGGPNDPTAFPLIDILNLDKTIAGISDGDGDGVTEAGDQITYQFEVSNNGNTTITNLAIADPGPTFGFPATNGVNNAAFSTGITCSVTSLAPGESTICTGIYTLDQVDINNGAGVPDGVNNTASASGTVPMGMVMSNSSSAAANIDPERNFTVDKEVLSTTTALGASSSATDGGDEINYQFTITNNGNVTISNLSIVDPGPTFNGVAGSGSMLIDACSPNFVNPGESITCTATYTLSQADVDNATQNPNSVINSAFAMGEYPMGTPSVTESAEAITNISNASSLVVDKEIQAGSPTIGLGSNGTATDGGDMITYNFTITNTGNTTISNVTIEDNGPIFNGANGTNAFGPISCAASTLAPGAITTCSATYTLSQTDVNNASLAANSVTNSAIAQGQDPSGSPVASAADATTTSISGAGNLTFAKTSTGPTTGLGANAAIVDAGDQINYTFSIENTGNVSINNIVVNDGGPTFDGFPGTNAISAIVCAQNTLDPGASTICTATYILSQIDIDRATASPNSVTNTANATGNDPSGANVTSNDDDEVDNISPAGSLTLDKTAAEPTVINGTDGALTDEGDMITYTFEVTNNGNVTLTNVTPVDLGITFNGMAATGTLGAFSPSVPFASLAPGATQTFTANYILTQTDIDNVAGVPMGVVNTARVSASDPAANSIVSPDDQAVTDIVEAAMVEFNKTASSPTIMNGTSATQVDAGDEIEYTYTISNNGNVTVDNIVINDVGPSFNGVAGTNNPFVAADFTCVASSLAPGESTTCSATYTLTQIDVNNGAGINNGVTNTASVSVDSPNGVITSSEDMAATTIPSGDELTLVKSVSTPTVANGANGSLVDAGDVIVYTFDVTNSGTTTINSLSISDSGPTFNGANGTNALSVVACSTTSLDPGDMTSCMATYVLSATDINNAAGTTNGVDNTASASGLNTNNQPVTSSPSSGATTIPLVNALALVKTAGVPTEINGADPTQTDSGDQIEYTFQVTNNGNVSLGNITINDLGITFNSIPGTGNLSAIVCNSNALNAGGTTTCSAIYTLSQSDINNAAGITNAVVNNAEATGTTPANATVTSNTATGMTSITAEPELVLTKSLDGTSVTLGTSPSEVDAGDFLTYNFTVENTGNVDVSSISIVDAGPSFGGALGTNAAGFQGSIACANTSLSPGQQTTCSTTYTLSQTDINNGAGTSNGVTNSATAQGQDPSGAAVNSVPASAMGEIPQNASLEVEKTANAVVGSGAGGSIVAGDVITYNYNVTNTGNVELTNVMPTDAGPTFGGQMAAASLSGFTPAMVNLMPNTSQIFTATYTLSQTDIDNAAGIANGVQNEASATGNPPTGAAVTAQTDNAAITLPSAASLLVDKAVSGVITSAGDVLTYTFTVTNNGNTTVDNIDIDDNGPTFNGANGTNSLSAISCISTTLAPMGTTTCTATYTVSQIDIDNAAGVTNGVENTAFATGTDPQGIVINSPSDDATTTISEVNMLDLVKSAGAPTTSSGLNSTLTDAGDQISYTFIVTNNGNTTLENIVIADGGPTFNGVSGTNALSAIICANDDLNPGQSTTCSATYILSQSDIDNGAMTPNSVVNNATATGMTADGTTISSSMETAMTNIAASPALTIEKSVAEPSTLEGADGSVTDEGDGLSYTYIITNTGNVTLTNVSPVDAGPTFNGAAAANALGAFSPSSVATLAPGASVTFTAGYILDQADINNAAGIPGGIDNSATGEGEYPSGTTITSAADVAETDIVSGPMLSLEKTAGTPTTTAGVAGIVDAGDMISYTFEVCNTGNVTIDNISINDGGPTFGGQAAVNALSTITCLTNSLDPTGCTTCMATYTLDQIDIDNGAGIPSGVKNTASASGLDQEDNPVQSPEDEAETTIPETNVLSFTKAVAAPGVVNGANAGFTDAGDQIVYTYTVTNAGNTTLNNVVVNDGGPTFDGANGTNAFPDATCLTTTLAPGEMTTCTATYTLSQEDINNAVNITNGVQNTANAVAQSPDGGNVSSGDDSAQTTITGASALAVLKEITSIGTNVGDQITYNFTVTNTGNTAISGVSISDPGPSFDGVAGTNSITINACVANMLAPGENATCTATYVLSQADIDNGAGITNGVTNSATATGFDPRGAAVSSLADDAQGTIPNTPSLVIEKSVTGPSVVNGTMGDKVDAGDLLTYEFKVTNNGNVTMDNIDVVDPGPSFGGVIGTNAGTFDASITCIATSLLPGASTTCTATYVLSQTDVNNAAGEVNGISNTASVDGDDPAGTTFNSVPDNATTEIPVEAALSIEKSSSTPTASGPMGTVVSGDAITYTYVVENEGNVTLTNVAPTDNGPTFGGQPADATLSAYSPATATIEPGMSQTYTAVYTLTQVDIDNGAGIPNGVVNMAGASGEDPNGTAVQALEDDAVTTIPAAGSLMIDKSASAPTVASGVSGTVTDEGDQITYTYTVTNNGNVQVNNIAINDEGPSFNGANGENNLSAIICVDSGLAPGAMTTCTATYILSQGDIDNAAGLPNSVLNTANAVGTTPQGSPIASPPDDAQTTIDNEPSLVFTKSVSGPTTIYGQTNSAVDAGDILTYNYTVTNTGNVTISSVMIADAGPEFDGNPGTGTLSMINCIPVSLEPGQSASCSATYVLTQTDVNNASGVVDGITNTASANGQDPRGGLTTSNADDATTQIADGAALTFEKTVNSPTVTLGAEPSMVDAGDQITYNYKITNTGNVSISNIVVNDDGPLFNGVAGQNNGTFAITCIPTSLDPGEMAFCSATYTMTQQDIDNGAGVPSGVTNEAEAEGEDPGGALVVSGMDAAVTEIPSFARLSMNKSAGIPSVALGRAGIVDGGDQIVYTYQVCNDGNVTIDNLIINDAGPTFNGAAGTGTLSTPTCALMALGPDECTTCNATYTLTDVDVANGAGVPNGVENTATAEGDDPQNNDVESAPSSATSDIPCEADATFNTPAGPICSNDGFSILVLSNPSINLTDAMVEWSGPGVTERPNPRRARFNPSGLSGLIEVCAKVIYNDLCEDEYCIYIDVQEAPTLPASVSIDLTCQINTVGSVSLSQYFPGVDIDDPNYSLSGSGIGQVQGGAMVYDQPGCYDLTLTYTGPCTISPSSVTSYVSVSEQPQPAFDIQDQACFNGVEFTIMPTINSPVYASSTVLARSWALGAGSTVGSIDAMTGLVTVDGEGVIFVEMTETVTYPSCGSLPAGTCVETSIERIDVGGGDPEPLDIAIIDPMPWCPNMDLTVSTVGGTAMGGVFTGTFVTDNGDGSTATLNVPNGGTYSVTYSFTDIGGCTSSITENFVIGDDEEPDLTTACALLPDVTIDLVFADGCIAPIANDEYAIDLTEVEDACSDPAEGLEASFVIIGATSASGLGNDIFPTITEFNQGITTIIYTVTNENGLQSQCSFSVTVQDVTSPNITAGCPPADVVLDCGDAIPPVLDLGDFTVEDCENVFLVVNELEITAASCPAGIGTLQRTYTFEDESGNRSSCSHTISFNPDTEAPMLFGAAPADVTIECSEATPAIPAVVFTDNCDTNIEIDFFETESGNPSCPNSYTLTRTWIGRDDCGNSSGSVVQVITVEDTTDPVFDPFEDLEVSCEDDVNALISIWLNNVSATDNCGFAQVSNDWDGTVPDLCGDETGIIITFTAVDECGNSMTATGTITSSDDITGPEFINCPSDITVGNNVDNCTAFVVFSTPIAEDCNNASVIQVENGNGEIFTSGSEFPLGTTEIVFEATDDCGNVTECVFNITVNDTDDPIILCPSNDVVQCAELGGCEWTSDNSVNYTFALENCPYFTITHEITGATTVPANTFGQAEGTVFNLGESTVTYTITDDNGNEMGTCSFVVLVEDCEAPSISCDYDDLDNECASMDDDVNAWITATIAAIEAEGDVAACSEPTTAEAVLFNDNSSCGNTINQQYLFTVTDAAGNSSTCIATYATVDNTNPVITPLVGGLAASAETAECDGEGNIVALQQWLANNGNLTDAEVTEACGTFVWSNNFASVEFDELANCGANGTIGRYDVEFIVTDECGNESAPVTRRFRIRDRVAPEVNAPGDITLECSDPQNDAIVSIWEESATATDVCEGELEIVLTRTFTPGCGLTGVDSVFFSATDACGNNTIDTSLITYVDDIEPAIECPEDLTIECGNPGNDAIISAWLLTASANDACDANVLIADSYDANAFSDGCGLTGVQSVTFTATDDCMNTANCNALIIIEDTTEPEVDAPANITVECDGDGNQAQLENWLMQSMEVQIIPTNGDFESAGGWGPSAEFNQESVYGGVGTNRVAEVDANASLTQTVTTFIPGGTYQLCFDASRRTTGPVPDPVTVNVEVSGVLSTQVSRSGPFNLVQECITFVATVSSHDLSITADFAGTLGMIIDNVSFEPAGVTGSDLCSEEPLIFTNELLTIDDECGGTVIYTYRFFAEDNCGNVSSDDATFTISDTEAPTITAPDNITLDCGSIGETTSPAAMIDSLLAEVMVTDICDNEPTVTSDFDINTIDVCADEEYDITITWNATDACGNAAITQTTTITIVPDTEVPVITAPDNITLDCGSIGETTSPAAMIDSLLAEVVVTDNCDTDPVLTSDFDANTIDVCADAEYDITITWNATDACGNAAIMQTTTITIVPDTEVPVITAPDNITLDCGSIGETTSPAAMIDSLLAEVVVTDNCDTDPVLTSDFDANTIDVCADAEYDITITWNATDACGNAAITQTTTITIVPDTEVPVITAPDNITLDCGNVSETTSPAAMIDSLLAEVIVTDNCDTDPVLTSDFDANTIDVCADQEYDITITWNATDACGNAAITQTTTITIVPDTEAPIITAPDNITLDCGSVSETTSPAAMIDSLLAEVIVTDNCDTDPVLTSNFDANTIDVCADAEYDITITWNATDACGNAAIMQTTTITVVPDTEAPVITPPSNITITCDEVGPFLDPSLIIDSLLAEVQVVDGCDTDPVVTSDFDGGLIDICGDVESVYTITWTATDACGNFGTATTSITIIPDVIPPVIDNTNAENFQAECNGASNSAEILSWLNRNGGLTATDDCSTVVWSNDYGSIDADCGTTGEVMVTFTASDGCGNTSSETLTFTINDNVAPTWEIAPVDVTFECREDDDPLNQIMSWLDEVGGGEAEDSCSLVVYSNNFTGLSDGCGNTGSATVTFTATDACGNSTDTTAMVTVVDNDAPTIDTIPRDTIVECGPDNLAELQSWLANNANAAASDVCGEVTWLTPTLTEEINGCGPTYTNVYTFQAEDACGNLSQAFTASFTVQDTTPPMLTVPAMDITIQCNGEGNDMDLETWLAGNGMAEATDICSGITWEYDLISESDKCPITGMGMYRFTATDACGNSVSTEATFEIIDNEAPVITGGSDMSMEECSNPPAGNFPEFDFWLDGNAGATATDDCSNVTWSNDFTPDNWVFTCGNAKFVVVTFYATDACGNVDSISNRFEIGDVTAPFFINCPRPVITAATPESWCEAFVNFSPPYALDNCSQVTLTQIDMTGKESGDLFPVGITVLQWEAADQCGNTDTCALKVVVNDYHTAPTIECPEDFTVESDPGSCGALLEASDAVNDTLFPIIEDNCIDNVAVVFEVTDTTGMIVASGVETVEGKVIPNGENTITYIAQDQPILLITEVVQEGLDSIEITNFGPASMEISCLLIERMGEGAEELIVPIGTVLAPGEVYVAGFENDIDFNDPAEYAITFKNTRFDVVVTNGYASADGFTGMLDGGDVQRIIVVDHDTAEDWVVSVACERSIGLLNVGLPVFADNGTKTGLQSILPSRVECMFNVTVIDVEAPECMTAMIVEGIEPSEAVITTNECVNSTLTIAESVEIASVVIEGLDITHPNIGDLKVSLTSPEGISVVLFDGVCDGEPDVFVNLSDSSAMSINDAPCDPLGNGGWFKPQGSLAVFCNTNSAGDWTIEVFSRGPDDGLVNDWNIVFQTYAPFAPMDVTIEQTPVADFSECGMPYTFTHPIIQDNCCDGEVVVEYISTNPDTVPMGGIVEGGTTTTEFFGLGTTTVKYTITDASGNTNMCSFDVNVTDPLGFCIPPCQTLCNISCKGAINVSLDEDCMAEITASKVVAGIDAECDYYYDIILIDEQGDTLPDNFVGIDQIGQTITYKAVEPECGNSCWGTAVIEDKIAPVIACTSDTISCAEFVMFVDPVVTENCGEAELILLNNVEMDVSCESEEFSTIVTRTFTARDDYGNESGICNQVLTIRKIDLDDIEIPANPDTTLICGSGFPEDEFGNPDASILGVPSLGGLPLYPNGLAVCNTFVDYEDEVFTFGNNCEVTIKRTWTIQNWDCGVDRSRTASQLYTVIDTTGPSFDCPEDVTASTSGFDCEAAVRIPTLDITDECNNEGIRVDISYPGGFAENSNGLDVNLPSGEHLITYNVYDICGNLTTCSYTITVVDSGDPAVVCDNGLSVSLSSDGQASITAAELDNGSFDACGEVTLAIRRTDSDDPFGDLVWFNCEDVMDSVIVAFQVTDQQGRSNQCMVPVAVQDNVPVQLLVGLPDITVSCEYPVDTSNLNVFGTIVNSADDREAIVINDDFVQYSGDALDAVVFDNCTIASSSEIVEDSRDQCGNGFIDRTVTATSPAGEQVAVTQRISFVNPSPFIASDITWPEDYSVTNSCSPAQLQPDQLPTENGFPRYDEGFCDQIAPTFKDRIVVGGGCYKILRTWYVSDWCQRVNNEFLIFEYVQEIEVENSIAPVIDGTCGSEVFTTSDASCDATFVTLSATATDDCVPDSLLIWSYSIDLNKDGDTDISGSGNEISGNYNVGIHEITWTVGDGCGNTDSCTKDFEVKNTKAGTPICFDGLSTALVPMDLDDDGMADGEFSMLTPAYFDGGSHHTCGSSFKLSFSADVTDTLKTFSCDDQGIQMVELWITDATGNSDFCTTEILVEDNNDFDFCPESEDLVDIQGIIHTEEGDVVDEVIVNLQGSDFRDMTNIEGSYAFSNMPMGGDYHVAPELDVEHLNGVSTIDLLMIQRHILGTNDLGSPYKLIAADINGSGSVTGTDLLNLRKLILGIIDKFPNNSSWRFLDRTYEFVDPTSPWSESLPETYPIYNLSQDMEVDFYAVKIGDVNGSVDLLSKNSTEVRSAEAPLVFSFDDRVLKKGEVVSVPIFAEDLDLTLGYQFTLESDVIKGRIIDVVPLQDGVTGDNFGKRYLDRGIITTSWNQGNATLDFSKPLFELLVKGESGEEKLSEILMISSTITRAEAYDVDGQIINVELGLREKKVDSGEPQLFQNEPNPWTTSTVVSFKLPKAMDAKILVYDLSGKLIAERRGSYQIGMNRVEFREEEFAARGIYYYELVTEEFKLGRRMVLIK